MNNYTAFIPVPLAEKLKEKGMHKLVDSRMEGWLNSGNSITYAEVFDWLMEKETFINIRPIAKIHGIYSRFEACIDYDYLREEEYIETDTWHKAADAAIEKALTLI